MTKDLSKQLCELCEIEPKIRYFLKFMHVEYETTKEDIVARSEIFKTGVLKITKVVRDYPDFTKPENFVKLLGLITKQTKEQNLETMLNHLKVNLHPYTEQTKQSIREAEWVYE